MGGGAGTVEGLAWLFWALELLEVGAMVRWLEVWVTLKPMKYLAATAVCTRAACQSPPNKAWPKGSRADDDRCGEAGAG